MKIWELFEEEMGSVRVGREQERIIELNMIKMLYMSIWKCHNETYYELWLIDVNKSKKKWYQVSNGGKKM